MTVKRAVRIALLTLIGILFSSPSLVRAQSLFSTEHVLQLYNKILYGVGGGYRRRENGR